MLRIYPSKTVNLCVHVIMSIHSLLTDRCHWVGQS